MAFLARVQQVVLRPRRYAIVAGVALLVSTLLAQTPLYVQLSRWLQDAVHGLTAQNVIFEDVLVVDVDEGTMAALESTVGAWPYPRDLYAGVLDYLFAEGARAVVLDMLLVEPRAGDNELSQALARNRNVWLGAKGEVHALARDEDYSKQLQRYSWPVAANIPRASWRDMLLPRAELGQHAGVGVISVSLDADGVLRRIAPFHRVYGQVVPAMPIAAIYEPGVAPQISLNGNELTVGEHRWPLDADGNVLLKIPRNRHFIRSVSFRRVLSAAQGEHQSRLAASEVRGRTVFIGSSAAILGDYARVPIHGRIAGLEILALTFSTLANDRVLRPSHAALDVLLILLAAALPLLYTNRRAVSETMITLWALVGLAAALTVHVAAFGWLAQVSNAAFAVLLGLAVWVTQMTLRFRTLHDEQQSQQNELSVMPSSRSCSI